MLSGQEEAPPEHPRGGGQPPGRKDPVRGGLWPVSRTGVQQTGGHQLWVGPAAAWGPLDGSYGALHL